MVSQIYGQTDTLCTGFVLSLDEWNMYDASPAWRGATTGSLEEKQQKMRDPRLRKRIIEEQEDAHALFTQTQIVVGGPAHKLIVQAVPGRSSGEARSQTFASTNSTPSRSSSSGSASRSMISLVESGGASSNKHILVNGVETFPEGDCTSATPGKLLRHGRG